ncbi:sigma factor-binding protein Crl [Vibrio sp. S11_S32]|uniref:sigma factor-binding protein Crl n=1 Tax=Vibrio sp. S11_S32 TaxID=2720225 RepID=UPI0016814229|nr:sigma factor-binding protein Crl [Vibrio sp. S11_S32]MBD1575036.1 sigma factor-binding protein Crl [Vibrio sp. S11_S32]
MTDIATGPTHFRLLSALRAVGPYLRESDCQPGLYLFDCLSVCVDETKSPELREFWGWWLKLERVEQNFVANYSYGKYDEKGQWLDLSVPNNAQPEVERTLDAFHKKIEAVLVTQYGFTISSHQDSVATES